jgi:hypothetical protein
MLKMDVILSTHIAAGQIKKDDIGKDEVGLMVGLFLEHISRTDKIGSPGCNMLLLVGSLAVMVEQRRFDIFITFPEGSERPFLCVGKKVPAIEISELADALVKSKGFETELLITVPEDPVTRYGYMPHVMKTFVIEASRTLLN